MAELSLPPQNQISVVIEGIQTDIICTTYSDKHFVVISQFRKFGTLLRASSEDKADGGKLFHIDTLFGKRDDPLLHVYARQIVERIASVSSKPLLLAIALKSRDTATFQSALNHLFDINTWQ